ncbi:WxL domain-containing protein [Levilactobacillus suantsaiihabitans]|uniref:WxL domain-containing protein n=1 Tax=Levilactobacillus suantsaiihabitans TaxID=2487722 RepID=A0A4Z0J9Z2_9LACO|nr:WxL domain-containing protein [Levilactobacillus suantsaiihabitans]TGD18231.1 hypothetical protein EGT51_09340 [Levilactobacillus suantsaiihabitans]
MFKKTLGFVTVAAAVVSLGLASATTANAADTGDQNSKNTTASVELKAGTGTSGAVTLVSAPSIVFTAGNLTGSAITATSEVSSDLVVKDAGSGAGWNVTVSATPMADSAKNVSLSGGSYTMNFNPSAEQTGTDQNTSTAPIAPSTKIETGADTTDSATNVFTAEAGTGVGTWKAGMTATELAVPSSAVEGNYVSTLTWTLGQAPA